MELGFHGSSFILLHLIGGKMKEKQDYLQMVEHIGWFYFPQSTKKNLCFTLNICI